MSSLVRIGQGRPRRWRRPLIAALLAAFVGAACASGDQSGPERQCLDTCESLGRECGEVCGRPCGECVVGDEGFSSVCVGGLCRCVPSCSPDTCGGDDGCGGTCPCPEDVTCTDCGLRLVRVAVGGDSVALDTVSVAVEWNGPVDGVLPRIADIRVEATEELELERVQIHEPLVDGRKLLHRFTGTNQPFRRLSDGSLQVLVFPGPRNDVVRPGRWLTLHFKNPSRVEGPLSFRLVPHEQMLAPSGADALANVEGAGRPLVVRPAG